MKKGLVTGLFLFAFPALVFALPANDYNPQTVGAGNPELHIKPDGTIMLRSGRVDQVVGTTFYVVEKWGALPLHFTVKTDGRTIITKRYGGGGAVSQVSVGDYLDVDGEFFAGSDFFGINALKVKDWSLQEESGVFAGVIADILTPGVSFSLRTPQNQIITVQLATSSSMKKGTIDITFGRLRKGDAIPRAAGTYDYSTNTLTADTLLIYQNKADFLPRNFEGTLKQIVSTTVPGSLIVSVSGTDYIVKINDKTAVQKKNKSAAQLARFVVGDTVRFYGGVREEEKTLTDALIVDAEVVRNLNL